MFFYESGRNTRHGAVLRDSLGNHCTCSDMGILTDSNQTDDNCPAADADITAQAGRS